MKYMYVILGILCFITAIVVNIKGNNADVFELTMYGWVMVILYTLTTIKERLNELHNSSTHY